ncbi:hypothetical protein JCM14469_33930 [Desulfatiferula olefinivorans]
MGRNTVIGLGILIVVLAGSQAGAMERFFYTPQPYGSEALYTPLSLFFAYTFDTVQLSENFDTHDMNERWDTVIDHLSDPFSAIDEEGGTRAFVNRQLFPMGGERTRDRYAMVPNYALHLFGGGLVFRKDAEYLKAHGYPAPKLWAAALAMTGELLQEAVEKKSTTADDEVADVLIFRPIGILLFSSDTVAGFIQRRLSPAVWPHLLTVDIDEKTCLNAGINYVIRPAWFGTDAPRLFVYMGMNNLIGLSHRIDGCTALSWGAGLSTTRVDLSRDIPAEFRLSGGLFYDRNNSLLWSAIVNGTENLRFRLNIYPLTKAPFWKYMGLFAGLTDDRKPALGLTFMLPLGLGGVIR